MPVWPAVSNLTVIDDDVAVPNITGTAGADGATAAEAVDIAADTADGVDAKAFVATDLK